MRSLLSFPSPHSGSEWLGARYLLPQQFQDRGQLVQAEAVLWLELPRDVMVGTRIGDPRSPVPFAETLEKAMEHPVEGPPRRPARIRVPDADLAAALEAA